MGNRSTREMRRTSPRRPGGQAGFSIMEIALVVAIIGITAVLATPLFVRYYQAARLRVGAEEVAAFLNQGRQIGIKENVGICAQVTATAMKYRLGDCTGATWVGPGTDAAGNIAVPDGIVLTPPAADPVFNYLGAASPIATYTVTNSQSGDVLHVFVTASGRVTIGP